MPCSRLHKESQNRDKIAVVEQEKNVEELN